jgi:aminocarboxymuconate-semialdehyde decarboxylase
MLKHLIERFGASQLMIGTDYPFAFHDARPVDSIAAAVLDEQVRAQIVTHNAARFLGIDARAATINA